VQSTAGKGIYLEYSVTYSVETLPFLSSTQKGVLGYTGDCVCDTSVNADMQWSGDHCNIVPTKDTWPASCDGKTCGNRGYCGTDGNCVCLGDPWFEGDNCADCVGATCPDTTSTGTCAWNGWVINE
jgi:hypothetical protein